MFTETDESIQDSSIQEPKFDIYSDQPIYCTEQIKIPEAMPGIMKEFTKAAIRTQPPDLLLWAKAYFEALCMGEPLPVKERFEVIIPSAFGLSQEVVKTLHNQLGSKNKVRIKTLKSKWRAFGLSEEFLSRILKKAGLSDKNEDVINWLEFLALACKAITPTMVDTMKMICEILTEDPRGGAARIPFVLFEHLYRFLTRDRSKFTPTQIDELMNYLAREADRQEGLIKPRNFMSPDCPPINLLPPAESATQLYWEDIEFVEETAEEKIIPPKVVEEEMPPMEEVTQPEEFAPLFKKRYHRYRKVC